MLSEYNDNGATWTSLTLLKASLPFRTDISLQAETSCPTLIIPSPTCMLRSSWHSPSSIYTQVSSCSLFLPPSLRCPFNSSFAHRKSQNSCRLFQNFKKVLCLFPPRRIVICMSKCLILHLLLLELCLI